MDGNSLIPENCSVGLSDFSLISSLNIYPNPVNDILMIDLDETINEFSVYDATGKKVNCKLDSNKLDVSELEAGIYQLQIEILGDVYRMKF